eukprot:2883635-Amphidinium_carterae.2
MGEITRADAAWKKGCKGPSVAWPHSGMTLAACSDRVHRNLNFMGSTADFSTEGGPKGKASRLALHRIQLGASRCHQQRGLSSMGATTVNHLFCMQ